MLYRTREQAAETTTFLILSITSVLPCSGYRIMPDHSKEIYTSRLDKTPWKCQHANKSCLFQHPSMGLLQRCRRKNAICRIRDPLIMLLKFDLKPRILPYPFTIPVEDDRYRTHGHCDESQQGVPPPEAKCCVHLLPGQR